MEPRYVVAAKDDRWLMRFLDRDSSSLLAWPISPDAPLFWLLRLHGTCIDIYWKGGFHAGRTAAINYLLRTDLLPNSRALARPDRLK